MPTQEEIYTKVSDTLVEALNVEPEDIKPTSTLQGDLGAESIDFLDIVFRLEREFGIKIPRGELFPESIFQGDPDFVQNGRVTDKGLRSCANACRSPTCAAFEQNPEVSHLSDLFTVDLITRYIQGKLQNRNEDESSSDLSVVRARESRPCCASGRRGDRHHALDLDRPLRGVSERQVGAGGEEPQSGRGPLRRPLPRLAGHAGRADPGGLAQTGGILVGEANQFREKVVLAKIPKAVFHREAMAGEQLIYEAEILAHSPEGAVGEAAACCRTALWSRRRRSSSPTSTSRGPASCSATATSSSRARCSICWAGC